MDPISTFIKNKYTVPLLTEEEVDFSAKEKDNVADSVTDVAADQEDTLDEEASKKMAECEAVPTKKLQEDGVHEAVEQASSRIMTRSGNGTANRQSPSKKSGTKNASGNRSGSGIEKSKPRRNGNQR